MAWNWIDLSQPFYEGMPHAAAVADPRITTIRDYPHMTEYTFVSHLGTHVDAPLHFISGGATIDQLPLNSFAGGGVIINIPKARNTAITAKDLSNAVPAIKPGDIEVRDRRVLLLPLPGQRCCPLAGGAEGEDGRG